MSYRNTPKKPGQPSPSPKSIKGPNLILPPGLDQEELPPSTLTDALKPSPPVTIYKTNQSYVKNIPAYSKSTSIEADMTTNTSSNLQFSPNSSITKRTRSRTVLRSRDSDFDLTLVATKSRPNADGGENTLDGKSNAELSVNFGEKKADGKSFVRDFLAQKLRANGTISALLENDRLSEEDKQTGMPYYNDIDTESFTKNILDKYQKAIPITEKDVLLPSHLETKNKYFDNVKQKVEESIGDATTNEIKLIKPNFASSSGLKTIASKEHLPEVKPIRALIRSPTEILYPNWNNTSVNNERRRTPMRYATQIKERNAKIFLDKNDISRNDGHSEISGHNRSILSRVGTRSVTNKEYDIKKKPITYFDLDVARERTVRKAMAPDPRGNIAQVLKKIESRRTEHLLFK